MMRFPMTVAVFFTMLPLLLGQSGTGHYNGAASPLSRWGAGANTFSVHEGVRLQELTFTASADGIGCSYPETKFPDTFLAWEEIAGWCADGEQKLMLMSPGRSRPLEIWDFTRENLTTVLEKYLKRFAAAAEIVDTERGCTRQAFRPNR